MALPAPASQAAAQIRAALVQPAVVGENTLKLTLTDAKGNPVKAAKLTLTVAMTSMDMGSTHPAVKDSGAGAYRATVVFSMAGPWRVTVRVETPGQPTLTKSFDFTPQSGHDHMHMHGEEPNVMQGRLGPWSMQKEGSGTSWLPESSPMYMKMLPKSGRYELDAMGFISLDENRSGGLRSSSRFFSNSMLMLMSRRETGGGALGMNLMLSADPIFNGEFGYPDLFQTGETAHGIKLTDFQHPHNLLSELTASYSHPVGNNLNGFLYGGPVGEPALGGPTFMHRPSGAEIPEAPITHHWFDSTHIAYGVVTGGINSDRWQLEASVFNGHEPGENRYAPQPVELNSASGRLTYNPIPNLSLNASYGFIQSPESTDPGVDQHRLTAAALWNQPLSHGNNLATTFAFGRNIIQGKVSDGYLLESTWRLRSTSLFGRWENVAKDELGGVPAGSYVVDKFVFGAVQDVAEREGFDLGIGAYVGLYSYPAALEPFYGKRPVTFGVFLRLRPSRMLHGG
ncbi:MAG TPA: FixH family protein [Fimbriimonadaceae bacterium]|nr:FixH family protein [Fimbriimonadaceae bacterium]